MFVGEIGEPIFSKDISKLLVDDIELSKTMADNMIFSKDLYNAWCRYLLCDWGNISESDKKANVAAVKVPGSGRILAKYSTCKGDIFIITEQGRSYTNFMFCGDTRAAALLDRGVICKRLEKN